MSNSGDLVIELNMGKVFLLRMELGDDSNDFLSRGLEGWG